MYVDDNLWFDFSLVGSSGNSLLTDHSAMWHVLYLLHHQRFTHAKRVHGDGISSFLYDLHALRLALLSTLFHSESE